jgi:hypothetical protein
MKHVSMLSPQEPGYRLRLEQRKLRWAEQERRAAQLAMDAEDTLRRLMVHKRPWRDDWAGMGGQGAAKSSPWQS